MSILTTLHTDIFMFILVYIGYEVGGGGGGVGGGGGCGHFPFFFFPNNTTCKNMILYISPFFVLFFYKTWRSIFSLHEFFLFLTYNFSFLT